MYSILIEFGITVKLVRLIKTHVDITYSEVWISRYLSENDLKQDTSWALLISFALEYAIGNDQVNKEGLKGTHQLLLSAYDANLLGKNINTVNKNAETLLFASKEVGLEVNTEKIMYSSIFLCLVNRMQDKITT